MDNMDKLIRLGEVIDALVAKDYTARGISHELYAEVYGKRKKPLAMEAVLALKERLKSGSRVLIFTGWPSRSWLISGLTETDGPVGAAILARALEEAFDVIPILVMEEKLYGFGVAGLRAAGLIVSDLETALKSKPGPPKASVSTVISFTTETERAESDAKELLDKIKPDALISIELPGANKEGIYHNVTGREVPTELVIKADYCMREASARGILTVGIGDGGNELGMGNAAEAIIHNLKNGDIVVPATKVDHLVVSCISNWGALGMAACIAAAANKVEIFDHIDIVRITDALVDAGAIDGLTAYVDPKNDGTCHKVNIGLTEMMSMVIHMHMGGWNKN